MAKLWGGRFTKGTDKAVEDFTSSIAFDARMYAEDIAGSKAHATMLAKQNIISDADRDAILAGLTKIKGQAAKRTTSMINIKFFFHKFFSILASIKFLVHLKFLCCN